MGKSRGQRKAHALRISSVLGKEREDRKTLKEERVGIGAWRESPDSQSHTHTIVLIYLQKTAEVKTI